MLPFEYTISHIAGAKIRITDYVSRSPKFEAPTTSKYDEQFVVKTIENSASQGSPRKKQNK